jgi:glutathione S-transferase
MVPGRFATGESCVTSVREAARGALSAEFSLIDSRLGAHPWWLEEWSGMDAYLFWLWARAGEGPFDLQPFANWARHAFRMLEREEVQRALDRERSISACYSNLDQGPI